MTFYKNKSVSVTGGAFFIGSHLVDELVKKGASVRFANRRYFIVYGERGYEIMR